MSTFYNVLSSKKNDLNIRGSLFQTIVLRVDSIDDIKENIRDYRKQHLKSSHICYAYRLCNDNFDLFNNPIISEYYTDAGEPSGTAGKPILNVLKSYKMLNVMIFVIRYFGGTKLGIPGLIQAYRQSSIDVLANVKLIEWKVYKRMKINYTYNIEKIIKNILIDYKCINILDNYSDTIVSCFSINSTNKEKMLDELKIKSNGTIKILD